MRDFAELLKHIGAVGTPRLARRLSLALALCFLAIPSAFAQSPYTPAWGATGLAGRAPAVTIDLAALDALGPSPNVASDSLAQAAPRATLAEERIAAAAPVRHAAQAGRAPRRLAHHQRTHRHVAAREHRPHVTATPAKPRPPVNEPHGKAVAATKAPAAQPLPASPQTTPRVRQAARAPIAQAPIAETPVAPASAAATSAAATSTAATSTAQVPTAAAPTTPAAAASAANPHDTGASIVGGGTQTGTTTVAALAAPIAPRATPETPDTAPKSSFTAKMAAPATDSAAAHPAAAPSTPAPVQVASVTPPPPAVPPAVAIPVAAPAAAGAAAGTTLHFAPGVSDLSADAHSSLNALIQRLSANQDLRVQLVAYASGSDEEANQARRLSLARAIAVRAYLIEQGVRGTRIDVRARGNLSAGAGPADRVDLVVLDR